MKWCDKILFMFLAVLFFLFSCGLNEETEPEGNYVYYYPNGADGGSVPPDDGPFEAGRPVTVRGNTGNLYKTGHDFSGWSTNDDGSGVHYTAGASFFMGNDPVRLYARWISSDSAFSVTYDGNGASGGTVPADSMNYESGGTVTVLGNPGGLFKTGFSFGGWNTLADGSGTAYTEGETFVMGSADVTLYAVWTGFSNILIAVFDDYDPDYSTPPFEDRLSIFEYSLDGLSSSPGPVQATFNLAQTVGGARAVSVSPDGTKIGTIENVANIVSVFDTDLNSLRTPETLPTYGISIFMTDGRVYTTEGNSIFGDRLRAYDLGGGPGLTEVAGSPSESMRGFDVVVDTARNVVWTTGSDLRRGDATTLTGTSVATYSWAAPSIDLDANDGSVWVAERNSVGGGAIHHYAADGTELPADAETFAENPFCVRVNPVTGDIWVAHSGGVSRISGGTVLPVTVAGAYWSLAVDPVRGFVWAAGGNDHPVVDLYDATGTLLNSMGGFSTSQKYAAFIR